MSNLLKFILTIFLASLIAYSAKTLAWTKLHVTNGERSWGGEFETLEAAQDQYELNKNNVILQPHTCAYGLVDRWIRFDSGEPDLGYTETREVILQEAMAEQTIMQMQYDIDGNELEEIEVTLPAIPEEKVTEYFYPQEFSVSYIDITAQKVEELAMALASENMNKGKRAILKVIVLNDARNATDEIKLGFLSNPSVAQAKSLLEIGRIQLAIGVIQAAEVDGVIITQDIKTAILDYLGGL